MRRNTTDRPARTFLTWSSAEARGARVVDYIEKNFATPHVSFVDTKGLGCKDLIYNDDTAAEAIARFKEADVDAVVMINANFGNEEAAADIAKALGVPPFALGQLTRRAGRRSAEQLKRQMELCVSTDFDIKRGAVREEAALDRLMLALTEK